MLEVKSPWDSNLIDSVETHGSKEIEKIIQLNKKDFKICVVCQRPFNWRKKWEKVWQNVKYCSNKCRSMRYIVKL